MASPVEEPPATSEEEEEAPPACPHFECPWGGPCYQEAPQGKPIAQTCVKPGRVYDVRKDCRYGCRAAADELAEEANEMAQAAQSDDWRPPQPERRPAYAVAYSVGGHLYEVAVPGDASVCAVDGGLIVSHRLGPVAGIVQVLPVINEGDASGDE